MEQALIDIHRTLGNIDAKIDCLLEGKDDHEGRIRTLERSRWTAAGALAVLTSVGTWLIQRGQGAS